MGILSRFLKNEAPKLQQVSPKGHRFIIGNWKCHKTYSEAREWFDVFAAGYRSKEDVTVVIAPPVICLEQISSYVKELDLPNVFLAAQDISPFPKGSYTGAIAADMVRGMVDFVIVGHSERRRYFHEENIDIINKVNEAVDAGIRPIVCIDKPHDMRQLSSLGDIDQENIIIAYSPVDALSFRIPETIESVEKAIVEIQGIYPDREIIYGGSLNPEIVADYLESEALSGIFVGSASLDPEMFLQICNTVK